ncbi:ABC transporter substrate-binding protein (plasmid) [Mesorhizobium sp. 131-3-5]|nr:ABC transporter substrate-binding protein [Mesorhizobium sp. 131-3-5]
MGGIAALGAILGSFPALNRAEAETKTLTVQTGTGEWGNCLKAAYFDPFEKATGIEVKTTPENLDNSKFPLQVKTGHYQADVQSTDSMFALSKDGSDYLEPIDYTSIKKDEIIPGFAFDNAVPLDTWTIVLSYNSDKTGGKTPKSWADFFDLKKFPGKRGVNNLAQPLITMALLADGVPAKNIVPFDYDRAFKKLDSIKSELIFFDSGSQVQDLLTSGEASLSMAFVNRADAARASGAPVGMVWNGALIGMDFWAVPKGNPNASVAMQFLSFVLSKEINGRLTDCWAVGPVNTKAGVNPKWKDIYPSSHLDEPQVFLDDPDAVKWLSVHNNEVQERFKLWKSE